MKIIEKDTPITDVLKEIDGAEYKTVYVTHLGKLIGSVTDGDIRRAIIKNGFDNLNVIDAMNPKPTYRSYDGKIINKKNTKIDIRTLPLLNKNDEIVDEIYVNEKFLPIAEPLLDENEFSLIDKAYKSSWISSRGEFINKFEEHFAQLHNIPHAVSCSNGTAALFLALSAIELTLGDEVIVPNLTFGAVANSVILAGGSPVFVDLEADRPLMDIDEIVRSITTKTKAILVVHSYGYVVNIEKLKNLIPNNIKIIEDCAEAHFAELNGNLVGTQSDIACYSFFANKILTTGEGGMCISSNWNLVEKMRILRDHGMSPDKRYWHEMVGFNLRLTNLQAAIGVAQLDRLESILDQRKRSCYLWEHFLTRIGLETSIIPQILGEKRGLWLYNIHLDTYKKNTLKNALKKASLETRDFFFCLNKMPPFTKYKCLRLDNAQKWEKNGLSLPVYSDKINNHILEARLDDVHYS